MSSLSSDSVPTSLARQVPSVWNDRRDGYGGQGGTDFPYQEKGCWAGFVMGNILGTLGKGGVCVQIRLWGQLNAENLSGL